MAAETGLYEKVLARLAEGVSPVPPPRVRASAAVVPWRRRSGELEVYWVRRSPELAFMGDFHAFPGGGLSRRDLELPVTGRPRGIDEGPADAGIPDLVKDGIGELGPVLPPGLGGCAARELFEEVGLLPAAALARREGAVELAARLDGTRAEVEGKKVDLATLPERLGVEIDLSGLVYAGRWLTPPLGPIRFDNRFFLLEWPVERPIQPRVVPGELASGEWIRPSTAVARWERGEVITAPPILHILKVLADEGPEAGLERLRNPAEANLGPLRQVEFRPGVVLFPLATPTLPPAAYTNAYLLGTEECVLIDPGSPFERELDALTGALEAAARRGRRVKEIWLTHHHPDHVGGVERMRRELGVPVAAHRDTARRLAPVGIEIDRELTDGQTVTLAGEPAFPVTVLHTPGHASGHLAFHDETFGSLISGDVVAGLGTIVIDPPDGDMDAYLDTLGRLERLAPRTLFPSHGPTVTAAAAKLREYREHRLWREERVLAAFQRGARGPAALVAEVYDELPDPAVPLAERQVEAHLIRLRRHGRI